MKLIVKQVLFLVTILCLLLGAIILKPHTFNTALTDLIPTENTAIQELTKKYTNTITLILEGPDFESVKNAAQQITHQIKAQNIPVRIDSNFPNLEELKQIFAKHQHTFLSEVDAKLIQTNPQKVTENALSDLTFSWVPPVLPITKDPFLLVQHYLTSLTIPHLSGHNKDGFLFENQQDKTYLKLIFFLPDQKISKQIQHIESLQKILAQLPNTITSHLSGIPLHSIRMYQKTSRQICLFSTLALLALLFLSISLLHKKTLVLATLTNLATAFACGTLLLWLMTNEIHLMTFVFAASLVGICVDYSFHTFTTQNINKSMFYSFLTSLLVFTPLLFSSLPLLRQIALFTIGGLGGTFISICLTTPANKSNETRSHKITKKQIGYSALLILILICCIPFTKIDNSPKSLYMPDKDLAQQEQLAHTLFPVSLSHFVITEGNTLQQAIETEENIRKQYNFLGLSALLPSEKKQKGNQQQIIKLYQTEGAKIQQKLHLNQTPKFEQTPILTSEKLFEKYPTLESLFLLKQQNKFFLIAPLNEKINITHPNVFIFSPNENLKNQLDTYAKNTYRGLIVSSILLLILLALIYQQKCLSYLLPTLTSITLLLIIFILSKTTLTFFHLISLFIVIGLGLDYTIFHINHPTTTIKKTVLFSFLSSFIGFGLLSFTTFLPVAIMGKTIALGLALSYLTSYILFNCKRQQ